MISLIVAAMLSQSDEVVIYRDLYGVPSIVAPNYERAMYGLGYATAMDHGEKMALGYKLARGRLAEVQGRSALLTDGFLRGLGIEDLASEKARDLPERQARPIDAFIEGANRALAEQRHLPDWIGRIERVDVLALTQFTNAAFALLDISQQLMPGSGSNQFAASAKRTTDGHAILSMDPHLELEGPLAWYEYAIYTPETRFRGVTMPGLPASIMGHTDRVGWCMTNNDPDIYDLFIVKPKPDDPTMYSYHGSWRRFDDRELELKFLEEGELKVQTQRSRRTAWGPMVPLRPQAAYLSMLGAWEMLDQNELLLRARSVDHVRSALRLRGMSMWNIVAADTSGDILYQYNARIASRDPSFDWSKPVDGSDPKTRLGPLMTIDELPHAKNPASQLLVNCNSAPWLTTLGDEISDKWPAYVTTYGRTTRFDRLSALLIRDTSITPQKAQAYATDTKVPWADAVVQRLVGPHRDRAGLAEPLAVLAAWNGRSDVHSIGCALYAYWVREPAARPLLRRVAQGEGWSEDEIRAAYKALDQAAANLRKDHGSLRVPWGDVHRLSRGGWSVPSSGWGAIPGAGAAVVPNGGPFRNGRFDVNFGSSWRMIVSFQPGGVQSWSILPFGQSSDPKSSHYGDQMGLYGRGEYKATNFGVDGAKRTARSTVRLISDAEPGKVASSSARESGR